MTPAPCRYCEKRTPYCRRDCVPWLDWQIIHEEERQAIQRGRMPYRIFDDLHAHYHEKMHRYYCEQSEKRRGK